MNEKQSAGQERKAKKNAIKSLFLEHNLTAKSKKESRLLQSRLP